MKKFLTGSQTAVGELSDSARSLAALSTSASKLLLLLVVTSEEECACACDFDFVCVGVVNADAVLLVILGAAGEGMDNEAGFRFSPMGVI